MADLTEVPAFFRLIRFKVAVVFDVFSRMPLAADVYTQEPTANDIDALLRLAITRHGPPRHFVSDQGPQFRSRCLRRTFRHFGVRHRCGAIGRVGSIAIIERFWRTLKESWGGVLLAPLLPTDLRRTLDLALVHYAYLRPHDALGGARPAEAYFRIRPPTSGPPPRGRPGEQAAAPDIGIVHLDPGRRLFPALFVAA
jgi:transposase InsO family protein